MMRNDRIWSFIRALNTGSFICYNLTNDFSTLNRSAARISKYCKRNFKLIYPHNFQMDRFISLTIHQLNLDNRNYYPTSNEQFGQNHDYFHVQKQFVDTYINQYF
jgi:hypothetical protein